MILPVEVHVISVLQVGGFPPSQVALHRTSAGVDSGLRCLPAKPQW